MTEIETAIYTAFRGDAALSGAAPGGLHNVQADSDAPYPRIVFSLPAGLKTNTFSDEKEELIVEFKIYTKDGGSSASLNDLYDKLKALYDDYLIPVNGYYTIQMRRTISRKTKDEVDEKVWIYLVQYEVTLEKI